MIDKFLPMVLEAEEEGSVSPILIHEKVTFVYIKHQNLYRILGRGGRERLIVVMGGGEKGRGKWERYTRTSIHQTQHVYRNSVVWNMLASFPGRVLGTRLGICMYSGRL